MPNHLPRCKRCGVRNWDLEGRLTVLFYAFGSDPEGPFKRECTVDSVHDLHIYCTGCGEAPDPASARLLEALYRHQDRLRAFHPAQGQLLAQFDAPASASALAEPSPVVRPGSST